MSSFKSNRLSGYVAFLVAIFSASVVFAQGMGGGGDLVEITATPEQPNKVDVELTLNADFRSLTAQVVEVSSGDVEETRNLGTSEGGPTTETFTFTNGDYYLRIEGISQGFVWISFEAGIAMEDQPPEGLGISVNGETYTEGGGSSFLTSMEPVINSVFGTPAGPVNPGPVDVPVDQTPIDTGIWQPGFCGLDGGSICTAQGLPTSSTAWREIVNPALYRFSVGADLGSGGGCSSCGGGRVRRFAGPSVFFEMANYPTMMVMNTDGGPGFSSIYSSKINMEEGYSGYDNVIGLFDAVRGIYVVFEQNGTTGEYEDSDTNMYRVMHVLDGTTKTDDFDSADTIELFLHNGKKMIFEVADLDTDSGEVDFQARLTDIVEHNGYKTTITYDESTPPTSSPHKYWMIDKVTDAYGEFLTFDYHTTQQNGRWSLSKVTLPTGGEIDFNYTDGFLTSVDYPDGNSSSITRTEDLTNYTMDIEWDDPYANTARRRKMTATVSLDYAYYDSDDLEDIVNQPAGILKQLLDGDDNAVMTVYVNSTDPNEKRIIMDGCLLEVNRGYSVGLYESWSQTGSDYDDFSGTLESVYGSNLTATEAQVRKGQVPEVRDNQGRSYDFNFDSDGRPEKKTYSDNTYEEWDYNSDGFLTRYRDRLKRVTKFEYDSKNNLTKTKVGILEVLGTDTNQTEYAEWENVYYGSTHTNAWLLKETRDPLYDSNDPELHSTIYTFNANHQLTKIEPSADIENGTRPDKEFTYTSAGYLYTSDDEEGRTTTFAYDDMGRTEKITYNDTSTEQFLFGSSTSSYPGYKVKVKDRNDIVDVYEYTDTGLVSKIKYAYETDSNILDATAGTTTGIEKIVDLVYDTGTCQVTSETTNGNKVAHTYDYRARKKQSTTYHYSGKTTVSKIVYDDNEVFYTENDLGARVYTGYEATDGAPIRTIVEMVDGGAGTIADNAAVLNKTRDSSNNAKYVITDAIRDDGGDVTEIIDGKGISTEVTYDSRRRETQRLEAEGTTIERKTERDYDDANNVTEIRHPRYFDSGDTNGYQKDKTVITYTGRNLVKDRTRASGHSTLEAKTSYTYTDDGKVEKTSDPRNKDWYTYYHSCCGRKLGNKNPLGHGGFSNTDYGGRVTHTAIVEDYSTHTSSHNPTDSKTLGETTTRYDARGRVEARTRWLTARGTVDENDPPIAGLDSVAKTLGLTTQYLYDDDLTDNSGLDNSTGVTVNKLGGGGTYSVSIDDCITKLAATTGNGGAGISFGTNNVGSAVVTIDPEEKLSVTIMDSGGHVAMVARIESHNGTNPNDLITWSCLKTVDETISGYGQVNSHWTIDAGGNITKSRIDSGGRTIENEDADNNVATYKYDANGNVKEFRDANLVGFDAVYNNLGQMTSQTDTYGNVVEFTYDDGGNRQTEEDAKNETMSYDFDVLGRRIKVTDRLNGETEYDFDKNGNVTSITDSQDEVTSYEFDDANQKTKTTYHDHDSMASAGDADYGIVEFGYDAAGRLELKTDQLGDTCTFNYDLAGRLTSKDYRLRVNSPSGTIADTDTYTYDYASNMLTAESGRYDNTITKTYDDAGRLETEELTIGTGMSQKSHEVEYEYNTLNQLWKMTYPDGTVIEHSYTDRSQLHTVKYGTTTIDTRTYDVGGRLTTSTYGNGVVTTYSYRNYTGDKDNLISSINIVKGMTTIDDFDYTYDANKNVTDETRTGTMSNYGWTTDDNGSSGFDKDDRLTYWERDDSNLTQEWSLSLVGNWNSITENTVSTTHTHGDAHELTDVGSNTLSYDAKGNMTTGHDGDDYSWDFDNQLTGADTDATAGDDVIFEYDALGRRVRKDDGTDDVVYVSSGLQVIAEYAFGSASSSPTEQYVYGSYVDEPIIKDGTLSSGTGIVYYHHDRRFSVIALTDANGSPVERYAYSPYGELSVFDGSGSSISSSAYANTITYTGRQFDDETELYYFRKRYYDPEVGIFVGRDPLEYVDGFSLYRGYFLPDGIDPFGLMRAFDEDVELISSCGLSDVIPCEKWKWKKSLCETGDADPRIIPPTKPCTCESTLDGALSTIESCTAKLNAAVAKINQSSDRVVLKRYFCAKKCSGTTFSLTCTKIIKRGEDRGKLAVGVCMSIHGRSRCEISALIAHEITHVNDIYQAFKDGKDKSVQEVLDSIDRVEAEKRAARVECTILADQKCLKGDDRTDFITRCVERASSGSLGGNTNTIDNACDKFPWGRF